MTEYLDDLEADFRVFYQIKNIFEMGSAQFFRFAVRTPFYKGVMRARVEKEHEDGSSGGESTAYANRVESTPAAMNQAGFDIEYASV